MIVDQKTSNRIGSASTLAPNAALADSAVSAPGEQQGLVISRRNSTPGTHPFDEIEWETRTAAINSDTGEVVFQQDDVEVPAPWSQMATNVVVSKYFKGGVGTPQRERSVKHLISRVADTIARWGREGGYFADDASSEIFHHELIHLLVNQKMAFNSPVWFNVGIEEKPQCSACFINSVADTMDGIMNLATTEALLFKFGSGTGTNLSPLRGSKERLSSGGYASGPVSFMRGFDAFAGVIKSGGKTRRAAKMVILDINHPDIIEFVQCKEREEKKAWALIEAGYDGSLNGEAYGSVFFQNSNNSVRVSDEFMQAYLDDGDFNTTARRDGAIVETHKARDLMRTIAQACWLSGDPGIQYDSTIQEWNPCSNTDRINATNPCAEYVFLDDTACNLASLNLMKYRRPDGTFDVEAYRHANAITILAQEILIDNASYPRPQIADNSHQFRPLGIGYANLGALLMSWGMPYDSDEARAFAGGVTAVMTGEAYRTSALVAKAMGPFSAYAHNREPFQKVLRMHRDGITSSINADLAPADLLDAAKGAWDDVVTFSDSWGVKNAQASVLAPTGTIAFMMDCDTTGVEPDIALVKYKKLVGGGLLKLVNNTVPEALANLGYDAATEIQPILDHIEATGTIERAPGFKDEHLPVFDCAFKPAEGTRVVKPMGHVRMVAAVSPFISGSISKTINVPHEFTVEEVEDIYVESWKLGLKCISLYRDGCKRVQPLNTSLDTAPKTKTQTAAAPVAGPVRRRLADERASITHKFSVGGHEGYITVGMYEDGAPGEIFCTMAKQGSVVSGLMDTVATATSISLQYGVPIEVLVKKFGHTRFEPAGLTNNPDIPIAKSVIDYVFRWLGNKFIGAERSALATATATGPLSAQVATGALSETQETALTRAAAPTMEKPIMEAQSDAPPCPDCGSMMLRSGTCYRCLNCGAQNGCS